LFFSKKNYQYIYIYIYIYITSLNYVWKRKRKILKTRQLKKQGTSKNWEQKTHAIFYSELNKLIGRAINLERTYHVGHWAVALCFLTKTCNYSAHSRHDDDDDDDDDDGNTVVGSSKVMYI
jgi:hypothetical protein